MKKNRSLLNVAVSIFFRIFLFLGSFFVRRYLIKFCGNDVNGLNSLYLSIIGVLSVAELGIGDAIIFCMYKPIVEGNTAKVSALYALFQRVYVIIGIVIAIAGCVVLPFIPYLAKGYATLDINLHLTFGLMLLSTVLTYFFSAKTSLINAYRNNYIATTISSVGQLLQQALQIIVLFETQSFVWYLFCRVVAALVQWIITDLVTSKRYASILTHPSIQVDNSTKQDILKNVKAMFMHRIGGVMVNTIDSIIISSFIGVVILGKYSNYTTIMTAMTGVLTLFFTPLTSTIGHIFVESKEKAKQYFDFFYGLNFTLGCVFFLGYYSVIDSLIFLLFGSNLALSKSISFVITVNYFIQYMRQSVLTFRDATGTFYYDRWKPIAEGLCNLALSILCVTVFQKTVGDDFAVVGVIVATIATNIFICHIVEPYVLFKHAFDMSPSRYYQKNYGSIVVFVGLLLVVNFCMVRNESKVIEILVNGSIAAGVSLVPIIATMITNKDFRTYARRLCGELSSKFHKT